MNAQEMKKRIIEAFDVRMSEKDIEDIRKFNEKFEDELSALIKLTKNGTRSGATLICPTYLLRKKYK